MRHKEDLRELHGLVCWLRCDTARSHGHRPTMRSCEVVECPSFDARKFRAVQLVPNPQNCGRSQAS